MADDSTGQNTITEGANNSLTPPTSKVLPAQANTIIAASQPASQNIEMGRIITSAPASSPGR